MENEKNKEMKYNEDIDTRIKKGLIDLEEFKAIKAFIRDAAIMRNQEFQDAAMDFTQSLHIVVQYINDYSKVMERLINHLEEQVKQKQLH